MWSDQKTYFLKSNDVNKKLWHFELGLIWLKIVVPRAIIVFQLKDKVP